MRLVTYRFYKSPITTLNLFAKFYSKMATKIRSMKMIEIPIAICFDKNYVIPASVAFYSLLENAKRSADFADRGGA